MENYKLVLPENLNHYGYLFGGNMLKWVDESAYVAARLDYPDFEFVTVALNRVEFNQRVDVGSILKFDVQRSRLGSSSIDFTVTVKEEGNIKNLGQVLFSTTITFVSVDHEGNSVPLPRD
ncbi:MAG: acyl-CoA thioesterase [Gammaproteobacteria bacterium]|nr:acyl-CoA thioesterase [Gammaproteobacteria bacterium]MCW8887849.1 acyl-CoA thioesterase [Gammaproteobacteria bacterium]MCW8983620.1 acyl-CoA thioesterase [Gammaproteobacteria bacterium]